MLHIPYAVDMSPIFYFTPKIRGSLLFAERGFGLGGVELARLLLVVIACGCSIIDDG
jgi:hypothetical protein